MKVYAVFEESFHEDIYERDNDGKCLVALYANEDDAMARLKQEADKVTVSDIDTKDVYPWRIEISKWSEVVSNGKTTLNHDCDWCWTIGEWEVL